MVITYTQHDADKTCEHGNKASEYCEYCVRDMAAAREYEKQQETVRRTARSK